MTKFLKRKIVDNVRKNLFKRKTLAQQEAITGWLFLAPVLIGFSIFTFGSMIYSLYISLTKWNLLSSPHFIGFENFKYIFKGDPFFWEYLWNTVYYVIALVPVTLILSLLFAVILNKKGTGRLNSVFRACIFLPCVVSTVAVSLVWKWILNADIGMLNNILRNIGVANPPGWLTDKRFAKLALVIMRVWQMSGYYMIMFLSGLQSIPAELYEAAKVDGASKSKQLFKITIPMLRPTTFAVTILLVLEAFNIFEAVLVMTEGRLGTSSLMYYIYQLGFMSYDMGYASAVAWIMFVIIMGFTILRFKLKKDNTL